MKELNNTKQHTLRIKWVAQLVCALEIQIRKSSLSLQEITTDGGNSKGKMGFGER